MRTLVEYKLSKQSRYFTLALIENGTDQVASEVYKPKEQERFVGKWTSPSFFDDFGKDILEEREGCAVFFE